MKQQGGVEIRWEQNCLKVFILSMFNLNNYKFYIQIRSVIEKPERNRLKTGIKK